MFAKWKAPQNSYRFLGVDSIYSVLAICLPANVQ